MKLCGFRGLKLGGIEVLSNDADGHLQQRLTVCHCCDSCCPDMQLASCGHAFCDRCLVESTEASGEEEAPLALCIACWKNVPIMKVTIDERFIGQLDTTCPRCQSSVRVKQLRDHLSACLSLGTPAPQPDTALTKGSPITLHHSDSAVASCSQLPTSCDQAESQPILENRLNAVEERLARMELPSLPVSYTLRLIYANGQISQVYRTATIYLRNVGFYFATDTGSRNLNLWLALRRTGWRDPQVGPRFRLTVANLSAAAQPNEMSRIIRIDDMDVGDKVPLNLFFQDSKRADVILSVRIEDLD